MAHAGQGDYELAISAYKEALRVNKAINERPLVAEALINMGSAAASLGQLLRAEANYRESLNISNSVRDRVRLAGALQGLADVARLQGRSKEAEAYLARALSVHDAIKNRRGTAEALITQAAIDLDARRPDRALARARQVGDIAHAIDAQELVWQAHTLMGRAYRQLGQRDAARTELNAAIEVVDRLRQHLLPRKTGRAGFLESRLAPFHELLSLSIEERAHAPALELAERAKARALADILQQGQADIAALMTAEERRQERQLQTGLLGLNQRIQAERLQATPDRSRIERLETERTQRRLELEAFEATLYSRHPDLRVQRGDATLFTLAETPQVLPTPATAILQYVVSADRVYLLVLTQTSGAPALEVFTLPVGSSAVTKAAQRFRERIATRDLSFGEDARRLYDMLVAPAAKSIAGKAHVIVVPDGPLWNVPFQALKDERERYWVESTAISYAPSLTVLRETLRRPPATSGARTLFAMGKAEFGSQRTKADSAADVRPRTSSRCRAAGAIDRGILRARTQQDVPRRRGQGRPLQNRGAALLDPSSRVAWPARRSQSVLLAHRAVARVGRILGGRSARGVGAARSKAGCGARNPLGVRNRTRAYRRRRGHGGDDVGPVRGGLTRHIGEPVEGRGEIHDGPDDYVSSRPGVR